MTKLLSEPFILMPLIIVQKHWSRLPLIVIHTVQIHTPSRYRKHCFPKITLTFYRTNTHAVRQLFSDPVYLHGIDYRTHTQTTMRLFSKQIYVFTAVDHHNLRLTIVHRHLPSYTTIFPLTVPPFYITEMTVPSNVSARRFTTTVTRLHNNVSTHTSHAGSQSPITTTNYQKCFCHCGWPL